MFMMGDPSFHRWNPFGDPDRFQRELQNLFGGSSLGVAGFGGFRANLWVNEEEGVLALEAPGVRPDDFDLSVSDSTVTLEFKREEAELEESHAYLQRQRRTGSFSRSFEMPYSVDADKVEARYENGVLQVKLPCAEAEKPTKIAVAVH